MLQVKNKKTIEVPVVFKYLNGVLCPNYDQICVLQFLNMLELHNIKVASKPMKGICEKFYFLSVYINSRLVK